MQAVLKDELQVDIALYEIPNRFKIVHYTNSPAEDRGKSRGPRYSPLPRGGASQAGGLLGSTAFVPVTPPLGTLRFQATELSRGSLVVL